MALQKHQYVDKGLLCVKRILELSNYNPFVEVQISFNKEITINDTTKLTNLFVRHLNEKSKGVNKTEKFKTYDNITAVTFGDNGDSCMYILDGHRLDEYESAVYVFGYLQNIIGAEFIIAGEIIKSTIGKGWKINLQKRLRDIVSKCGRPVYYVGAHQWSYMDDVYISHKAVKADIQGFTTESGAVCNNQEPLLIMPTMFYQICDDLVYKTIEKFDEFSGKSSSYYLSVRISDLRKFYSTMVNCEILQCRLNKSVDRIKGVLVYLDGLSRTNLFETFAQLMDYRRRLKCVRKDFELGLVLSLHHFDKSSNLECAGLIDFIREYEYVTGEVVCDSIGLGNVVSECVSHINYRTAESSQIGIERE